MAWPALAVAGEQAAASRSVAPAAAATFDEAARRATAARERGQVDVARTMYRRAVTARPSWDEGWWYLGALSYESARFTEASEAFRRFVVLKPDSGPGWAMRGLSEFAAGRHEAARTHLTKALQHPTVGNAEIRDAVYLQLAQLHIRSGDFELAVEPLATLAQVRPEEPTLVAACGLVALRQAWLPSQVPADKRELVLAAGRASYAALGRKPDAAARFEELLGRFPGTPGLHYAYGAYLRAQGAESLVAALEQFHKEIEVDPAAIYPRLEIAFELMKNGEHARALPYAEAAVQLAPALFAAHHALGRALLETGDVAGATRALEQAVKLAPEVPEPRAALARVYVQAGRREDAQRERAAFEKLQARRAEGRTPGRPADTKAQEQER